MTVDITKPALNLRKELDEAKAAKLSQFAPQVTFTANGTETNFTLGLGLRPYMVFSAGLLRVEGAAEEYTVTYDGFRHTVKFAVAPADGTIVAVMPERIAT